MRAIKSILIILIISISGCNSKSDRLPFKEGEFKEWAQTPPMGWNSWDSYGPTVKEHEVKENADYMAKYLKEFGWNYIVVDIRWFVQNDKAGGYNQTDPIYVLDEFGRYIPATNRFPSAKDGKGFKELANYIHDKGLKFGIHIMRGIPKVAVEKKLPIKGANGVTADQIYTTDDQCEWLNDNYSIVPEVAGAQEYYNSIFELYAEWGVDFIKIDDLSAPIYHEDEINMIRKAIDHCGRPIVLSASPGPTPISNARHISNNANMWRMVNDVWDSWEHIDNLFDTSKNWYPYINSGTWPDCDMIPLGRISIRGERGEDRMSKLTQKEQFTLMTFFTIFKSPLFFGGDLPSNDAFTLSLLTNKEVLKMHKESIDVRLIHQQDEKIVISSKNRKTGETYLALFNTSNTSAKDIKVILTDLEINKKVKITNIWSNEELGVFKDSLNQNLSAHESVLLKITVL